MKYPFKVIALCLMTTLLIYSCEKETSSSNKDVEIILPKTELKTSELALIEVNTALNEGQLYTGMIESESVEFHPNSNFLIFKVPSGTLGTKNGTVTINGKDFAFSYQLIDFSFTDKEVFIESYLAERASIQTEMEDLQSVFIDDEIPGHEDIENDLAVWEQITIDAEAEIAALSDEDKESLAQLIDANSEWIQRMEEALLLRSFYFLNKTSSVNYSKQDCKDLISDGELELSEGNTFAAAATAIEAYWCGLTFDERQYDDLSNDLDRGVLLFQDLDYSPGPGIINTLTNIVFRRVDALAKELQGAVAFNGIADEILEADQNKEQRLLYITNGEPEAIFAKIVFRSVNQNDINATGEVGQVASFFDQIISSYNEILEVVDRPLIWRPGFIDSYVIKDFNRFLSVPKESVTNSDVILVNTQYRNDNWEVVFGNDGTEQTPMFNFDLKYDDGYVQLQRTISAVIDIDYCGCNGLTSLTDTRDGRTYQLVEIGCQCWFAENMKFVTDSSTCPNNDPANCNTYGRLYIQEKAMVACPSGWHLPSEDEFNTLADHLGGSTVAGGKMKATTGWNPPNTDATNSSGFSALPGGSYHSSNTPNYQNFGEKAYYWTSTPHSPGTSVFLARELDYDNATFWHTGSDNETGFYCRCLKD